MIYEDLVYGRMEINEPIVLEIIDSPEIQRLKGVDQTGYNEPFFPGTSRSRFEHSVGVYLLLKKYGAPLEEQIAGLIHDVSHGTFSHCLDYVFEEGNQKEQSHQDSVFDEFVRNSSIPGILTKYGWNIENILDDSRHPLKEKDLPNLCADRIDYSLRDAAHHKKISKEQINKFLDNLKDIYNIRIFDNFEAAREYVKLFSSMDNIRSGIETAVMFVTISALLKYAWNKGYVERNDFYTTDKEVLNKITKYLSTDDELNLLRDRMNNRIPFENNPNNYHGSLFCKSRSVDPLFMEGGGVLRVSDVDTEWKDTINNKNRFKEYFIKFER